MIDLLLACIFAILGGLIAAGISEHVFPAFMYGAAIGVVVYVIFRCGGGGSVLDNFDD